MSAAPDVAERSRSARWYLQLLGRVHAQSAQHTVDRWPSRAVAALTARLALAPGRSHPREELIELLWPGVSLESGRSRLRQALHLLRQALACDDGVLAATRHDLILAVGAIDCDVLDFERCIAKHDAHGARALYQGELMPGFYDEWIAAERSRLAARFEALGTAPTSARTASVPSPRATLSFGRPTAVPASGLPSYLTRAFGQDASVAAVCRAVQITRWVTLVGPGGQGKTRLAVAAAHAFAARPFPALGGQSESVERVVFVSLIDRRDAHACLDAIAGALRTTGPPPLLRKIAEGLHQQPCLLMLDNADELSDEAAHALRDLLLEVPSLRLLLTSRRRFGLDGEHVIEVAGLGLAPEPPTLQAALASAAVALFVDRARASRAEFRLTENNLRAVAGLVRHLDGMPLAIELAASRLRVLKPQDMLTQLQASAGSPLLDLLTRPTAGPARARHASLRQVVAWSWQQLRPEVASLLRALSVFVVPVSPELATHALHGLGGAPRPVHEVRSLLNEAAEASLLQLGHGDEVLATLLPPVREFAAEQCSAAQAEQVRAGVRRWLTAQCLARLPHERQALRHDFAHVPGSIVQAAAVGATREGLALAAAMQLEWQNHATSPELIDAIETCLTAQDAQQAPVFDALVSAGHSTVATMRHFAGTPERGTAHAERACLTAPDDAHLATALVARSLLALANGGDYRAALAWLAEAVRRARGSPPSTLSGSTLAIAVRMQGMVTCDYLKDYAAGEPLIRESVSLQARLGDDLATCRRQSDLAMVWYLLERNEAALELLGQCLQETGRHGATATHVVVLTQLGRARLRAAEPAGAAAVLLEAALLAWQQGWIALHLRAMLHLPRAWVLNAPKTHAERAAVLQGYATAAYLQRFGHINHIEAREAKLARRVLRHVLRPERAEALAQSGAVMTPRQALALLAD